MGLEEDERFMRLALQEAQKAYREGEVPIGALLVAEGRIIARGHNQVERLKDPTAHAEILCIGAGAEALDNWRLLDTTLYCTMEPCAMCAGALLLARVARLVWGAPDLRQGANGSWCDLFSLPHPIHPSLEITPRLLAEPCGALVRQFFQEQRNKTNPNE